MNVDVAVVLVYLVATTLFGCSFYFRRGRDRADEFTKAGGRLPGWALALSVFATYVSSISFLALPAKAYLSNWNALVLSFSIPFAACAAAVWFVPFYRRQTSASAYSFLEARFGAWSRLYASGCFLVMQSVRSGMILYLLALVLNTLLGVDMPLVICVVGVATMLYSMMGGLHAVVWTDVVQSVVLIAGALLSLAVIAFTLPDGLCAGVSAAFDAGKLSLGDFSLRDWGSETFWVTFAYGVFLNLQNFGIDQTYTQRYVAAKSDREAVRSMFSGAMLYLPVSLVFVAIGTLLWAWVKSHPGMVPAEVLAKSDAVFPWFIIHRLPTGVSGLLVAAIIAAAMSTVSSTLNSGATVLLEDYAKRFSARARGSEGAQVVFLRLATVGLGLFAVGVALAVMNVTSVLTTWWALQSVLSGGMLGLFLIGAFSRRTRSAQAAVATAVGVLAVAWVVFGARLLDLPQVLHVNLAMVVGTAALVLVGAFPVRRRVVALAAALLPFASSATIAVDVAKPPVKDQRCIRAGAGIGYSGSLGHDNWANFEQFFVKEPDRTWDVCRAGGYWYDRTYGASQGWQQAMVLVRTKDPAVKAAYAKKFHDPAIYFDWCRKHGVRNLLCLENTSAVTNYQNGASSSRIEDVKKGIAEYVQWIVDNGYRDQVVGFELGNEPYWGDDPEGSAARWAEIVPEIKRIFPEAGVGIAIAEYREGDPDVAAVRRRSTAVDKWFEGGSYYGFNKVNQWSGRFIVASSNYLHLCTHVIYHFYGGNVADGLGPCGYTRIRNFAKAFPEIAHLRVWISEWRERSDEDDRCQQMFSSTLTKAHYILSSTAAPMFDGSNLHTASSISGGFSIANGHGSWQVQWDPAGRDFTDPDFTGHPRIEVGPAGPMFRLYNEALQGHPLICAFGGWERVKDPERDWTGVCFYGGTGRYEKWYSGGQGDKYPDSGGGPTWVAAASPDRSSVNLLVCNSSHAEWHQKFEFPGFRIAGKRRVRTYSCPAKYVQCHMIPGEPKPSWEEDYETDAEELTIKPYTIATVSCRLERPKAVVGILADASAGTRALTEKALCFFRDHGVDAILHTGGPDGAESADYAALRDGVFTNRPPREVFVGSACERLDLAGYPLVVAPDRPERTRYEELVAKAAADRTAGPVFVLQPRAAEGTAGTSASPGEGAAYADGGSMRQFLDRFPGVVAVSGGRTSPRDVRSIWQGGFTALEAGGLGEYAEPYVSNQRNTATNREVVLMHVWDDRVDFTRHDVATGETTVPTWSVKLPHDPQNAAFGADKLASRCETGYFSKQCRKLTVRRNADDALEVGFQEACGKMDAVSFTWRYRVEVYDVTENDAGRLLARQDVRGAWDLPGRFGDWNKTTRPKAATFSAAVSSGWNRIRVVVTPESFAGELGESIRQVVACPAAQGAWRRTWSGAPPAERRGNGWRCALDGSAFAGAPGDRYTVAFSLGVDADARAEVVNAAGVVKGGFAVAGLGADRPLRYAIEFAAVEGDGELALVVSSASAKDAAVKNVSVHRLATHHYFGKVSDTAELEKIHPRLKKAFDFLRRKDLDTLACGTYELEAGAPGEKAAVFAMVQELDLKPAAPGPQRVEAHGRYIDVQAPLSAAETFGVAELDPTRPDFPFDAGKDIGFIDLPCELKTVKPGEFAVFMPPRGAHAPCLSLDGPRRIRKVVVKVLAD